MLLLAVAVLAGAGYSWLKGGTTYPSFREEYRKSDSLFAYLASANYAAGAVEDTASVKNSAAVRELVNINTARVEELDALPGIGPVIAQRIVDYRNKHGKFRKPEDLIAVKSIGKKKFEYLKSYISISE